jgi:hypothetical protein
MDSGHLMVSLFYRAKTSKDNYLKKSFYNATRDFRHALFQSDEYNDYQNNIYIREKGT